VGVGVHYERRKKREGEGWGLGGGVEGRRGQFPFWREKRGEKIYPRKEERNDARSPKKRKGGGGNKILDQEDGLCRFRKGGKKDEFNNEKFGGRNLPVA